MTASDVVLLTGLPSLLSRAVCAEIVSRDPRARVEAVVRSKFVEDAREALDSLSAAQRRRVHIIEGDAAAIDLGLSGAEFKSLARDVTRIHHSAQVTYLGVDKKTAEHVNVGSAQEVVELAASCENLECLVFHSTAQVSGGPARPGARGRASTRGRGSARSSRRRRPAARRSRASRWRASPSR